MHRKFDKQSGAVRRAIMQALPRSFSQTARQLGLQGWEQGHSELIVSRSGLIALLQSMLEATIVDDGWYLQTYPDVQRAIVDGSIADATTHYREFGYFEGRLPSMAAFDAARYLEKNPDLHQPLGSRGSDAILEHFLAHGYREGREF